VIKCVLFDLDGVLIDAKQIHYQTLNQAIESVAGGEYTITEIEHLSTYDGLKTNDKLHLLSQQKNLPQHLHETIWQTKQQLTAVQLQQLNKNWRLCSIMAALKDKNYSLACCSNSIRQTIQIALSSIGILDYMDLLVSNQDVGSAKPYPEVYWKAMTHFKALPEETLIVEDSPHGLLAAARSGAHVLRVKNVSNVTLDKIQQTIEAIERKSNQVPKWQGDRMNILIPMAGAGARFQAAGYSFPKPLIDVNGKPMIQTVVENLNIDGQFIFVVQKSHRQKYNLDSMLNLIAPGCKIVETDGVTEGAACTTLLASEYIDNDQPLLMANSDQYLDWNSNEFMYKMQEQNADGGIITFTATHPKWSFVKLDDMGNVTEVAEKNPISNIATVGVYYWAKGSDYVKYANQMINQNFRVNNEFYVCPVYSQAIEDGLKIRTYHIDRMWGLGTPEDLNTFIQNRI
jgi:HAD superfamily hydrolase (TIGR01509 family)